jgi:hypothetical protein
MRIAAPSDNVEQEYVYGRPNSNTDAPIAMNPFGASSSVPANLLALEVK